MHKNGKKAENEKSIPGFFLNLLKLYISKKIANNKAEKSEKIFSA